MQCTRSVFVVAVGIPGCGKSSVFLSSTSILEKWFEKSCLLNVPTCVTISQDMFQGKRTHFLDALANISQGPPTIVFVDKNHQTAEIRDSTYDAIRQYSAMSHPYRDVTITHAVWHPNTPNHNSLEGVDGSKGDRWGPREMQVCTRRILRRSDHATLKQLPGETLGEAKERIARILKGFCASYQPVHKEGNLLIPFTGRDVKSNGRKLA
eukprot:PhF_6_TR12604/c0_g1_i1/m.19888